MGSLLLALALDLPPRSVECGCPHTITGRFSRPMFQYSLLDPQTKLPTGEVWQTSKSPEEIRDKAGRPSLSGPNREGLFGIDYETLELRALAQAGVDIHAEMARALFQDAPGGDPKVRRQSAQTVAFAALYGGRKLAKVLKF